MKALETEAKKQASWCDSNSNNILPAYYVYQYVHVRNQMTTLLPDLGLPYWQPWEVEQHSLPTVYSYPKRKPSTSQQS